MIIRYPDRRDAGTAVDELVSFVDIAPTLLYLAGRPAPEHMHGRNFLDDTTEKRQSYDVAEDRTLDRARTRVHAPLTIRSLNSGMLAKKTIQANKAVSSEIARH